MATVAANNIQNCYAEEDKYDASEEVRINLSKGKNTSSSEISSFFAGQCLFITGGTGFLGKILIEKLLRSCSQLDTIYVLVRTKKGQDPNTRIQHMLQDIIFKKALEVNPKAPQKVVAISGDFKLPALGISTEDRKLITDRVSIIIHAAATVRFDEHISLATAININGTRDIISLAKECKNLRAVTHVSTAFAHCYNDEIEERFYDPPMSVEAINSVASIDEKILEDITPKLIGKFPNTYCFTKAISEDAVRQYGEGMPICIVRPAIVVPTYEEPIRGWTDNLYGPTGIMIGIGTGVLRTMYMEKDKNADIVPVDFCVNSILAATWCTWKSFKENQTSDIPIYNYVSSPQKPITWGNFIELNRKHGIDFPTMKAVWYYGLNITNNYYMFLFYNFFLHYLPALLADCYLVLTGNKRMMLGMYHKLWKLTTVLLYFSTRDWKFHNDNVQNLWKKLSKVDQTMFPFNIGDMSWDYHAETFLVGLRVYLVKDDLSTLPEARKRWNRMFVMHTVLKAVTYFLVINFFYWLFKKVFLSILW